MSFRQYFKAQLQVQLETTARSDQGQAYSSKFFCRHLYHCPTATAVLSIVN
jgi:hypothetical protein